MANDKTRKAFEKQDIDEEQLLKVIGGEEPIIQNSTKKTDDSQIRTNKAKPRAAHQKNGDYADIFLTNRYPGGRNGKVVYIRPEFHQRLLRMVQLDQDSGTTLYAYIDNILEHHFKTFGEEIRDYFNDKYKPII